MNAEEAKKISEAARAKITEEKRKANEEELKKREQLIANTVIAYKEQIIKDASLGNFNTTIADYFNDLGLRDAVISEFKKQGFKITHDQWKNIVINW